MNERATIAREPLAGRKGTDRSATVSHQRSRSRKVFIGVAIVTLAIATIIVAWRIRHPASSVHYDTVVVGKGAVERAATATGTVNPVLTIIVGSYVSGVIQSLSCDYNTLVKTGQVCATIDPRPYQTIVNQAKANLAVSRAQLEKDRANAAYLKIADARNRRLVTTLAVSQDVVDQGKNALDQADAQISLDQATIDQRLAELDAAQVNLDYTMIVSPVDGTVVSRNVTQGQTVASSFQTPTLFLIATDLTKMQVDTNVSESDIGGMKEGDIATFTVDAYPKKVFKGRITQVRVSPQTVQNVVTYDAVIGVDNQDLALMPGMTASTRIVVERSDNPLRVPDQAFRYSPGGLPAAQSAEANPPNGGKAPIGESVRVWILRDGAPTPVKVRLGLDDNAFTEIVGGDLREGDQVIVGERSETGASKPVPPPRF